MATRDTRETILEAARPLFARQGFEGTSVRQITRTADVNLGAVTYHFGSKRALYDEVLARATRPLADAVARREEPGGAAGATATDRIETALRTLLGALREHPDLPGLLFQEAAAGRDTPEAVSTTLHGLLERLAGLVRHGKTYESLEAGDPVLTAASLLAQTLSFGLLWRTLARPAPRGVLGRSQAGLEAHVVDFTRRALARQEGGGRR